MRIKLAASAAFACLFALMLAAQLTTADTTEWRVSRTYTYGSDSYRISSIFYGDSPSATVVYNGTAVSVGIGDVVGSFNVSSILNDRLYVVGAMEGELAAENGSGNVVLLKANKVLTFYSENGSLYAAVAYLPDIAQNPAFGVWLGTSPVYTLTNPDSIIMANTGENFSPADGILISVSAISDSGAMVVINSQFVHSTYSVPSTTGMDNTSYQIVPGAPGIAGEFLALIALLTASWFGWLIWRFLTWAAT